MTLRPVSVPEVGWVHLCLPNPAVGGRCNRELPGVLVWLQAALGREALGKPSHVCSPTSLMSLSPQGNVSAMKVI